MEDFQRFVHSLSDIFKQGPVDIREVCKVFAINRILGGERLESVCTELKLQRHGIERLNNALKRQESEKLPYVFLVLSVPELGAGDVAKLVPDEYVWTLAVLEGRRVMEEAIVERLRSPEPLDRFNPIVEKMPEGKFRVISAKKADSLLRAKLFERVQALSLKGFTRRFRNAEVDMHLSLSTELTPVRTFFELLVQESPQKFAVRLYIGDY
ncbi:MAG: hypothetical protein ACE5JD_00460 [Candidatus Methylomirabilia bacterium]